MLNSKYLSCMIDVVSKAAYASSLQKGKGNKNLADQFAVDAMRKELNNIDMCGKVVIGEGEMDEAPMLYIGEILGKSKNPKIDIAVDPLDGTKLAANNEPNAISVIAIAEEGNLLQAPDTYMEKISIGSNLPENIVDLDEDIKINLKNLAKAKSRSIKDITVCLLDRPRHHHFMEGIRACGSKMKLISDGDVAGSIYSAMDDSDVDMYVGIGGAPEGVLAAAAIKCLGGQFQARLKIETAEEVTRAQKLGIKNFNKKYILSDIVKDDVIFCAAGVTDGDLLKGIEILNKSYKAQILALHSSSNFNKKITKEFKI